MLRHYGELSQKQFAEGRFLCVGLDPDLTKLPALFSGKNPREAVVEFNRYLVEATKDIAGFYKPNSAFYEAHGEEGWAALRQTIALIHEIAPETPVILDAKRADIGNTNEGYVRAIFDDLQADAVTLHPYLGAEALEPFLARADKGAIILCRTSNQGSGEFQDLLIDGEPLFVHVAWHVANSWNKNTNCGLVVGATYPEEIRRVREVAPGLPFLIPGVGAQGGDTVAVVRAGKDAHGQGLIVNASRAILYASSGEDFAEAARAKAHEIHDGITKALIE